MSIRAISADPFDAISIHKTADSWPRTGSNHAAECVAKAERDTATGAWCVVRHVPADNPIGAVLKDVSTGSNETLRARVDEWGRLGFCGDAAPATFNEEDARAQAARWTNPHARDEAVPVEHVTWRVLVYSHYDSSRVELYRGQDLASALAALHKARAAVVAADGFYIEPVIEGVVAGGTP